MMKNVEAYVNYAPRLSILHLRLSILRRLGRLNRGGSPAPYEYAASPYIFETRDTLAYRLHGQHGLYGIDRVIMGKGGYV